MPESIQQNKLTPEIKEKIYQGFTRDSIQKTGINGLDEDSVSFEMYHDSNFVGAVVTQLFWGQLHIKYLFVDEASRGRGLGTQLMLHALKYGRGRGCDFAFIETMNFQAPEFYQKLGFEIEYSRSGYAKNTTLYYLKKDL